MLHLRLLFACAAAQGASAAEPVSLESLRLVVKTAYGASTCESGACVIEPYRETTIVATLGDEDFERQSAPDANPLALRSDLEAIAHSLEQRLPADRRKWMLGQRRAVTDKAQAADAAELGADDAPAFLFTLQRTPEPRDDHDHGHDDHGHDHGHDDDHCHGGDCHTHDHAHEGEAGEHTHDGTTHVHAADAHSHKEDDHCHGGECHTHDHEHKSETGEHTHDGTTHVHAADGHSHVPRECTVVFDAEGSYCLEDRDYRPVAPMSRADALACLATDECEIPEQYADLLEVKSTNAKPSLQVFDSEGSQVRAR